MPVIEHKPLKDCPFCGAQPFTQVTSMSEGGDSCCVVNVGCYACGFFLSENGPHGFFREGDFETNQLAYDFLATRWNARVEPS